MLRSPHAFSLRQLQYIVAVADYGGFTRAAEQCHVSQPSLSAQVAQAEEMLGVTIFERGRGGPLPTEAGNLLLERMRAILLAADELQQAAQHLVDPFSGTMRIGVIPTIAPYLLPDLVGALHQQFPKIRFIWVEERTATLATQLRDGRLDAILVARLESLSEFVFNDIAWDPFVVAVGLQHELAKGVAPVTLDELSQHSLLLLDEGHCFRDQALEFCAQSRPNELDFRATSLSTLAQMVAGGAGITLLPTMSVPNENRTGNLVIRPIAGCPPGRHISLMWRQSAPGVIALKAIAKAMAAAGTPTTRAM
jgi:LysR family transcriptional regulator, hydrogen peroxide-inducible genes activator